MSLFWIKIVVSRNKDNKSLIKNKTASPIHQTSSLIYKTTLSIHKTTLLF